MFPVHRRRAGPPGPKPFALVPKIACPILVLWGSKDSLTPVDGPVGKFFRDLPSRRPSTQFKLLQGTEGVAELLKAGLYTNRSQQGAFKGSCARSTDWYFRLCLQMSGTACMMTSPSLFMQSCCRGLRSCTAAQALRLDAQLRWEPKPLNWRPAESDDCQGTVKGLYHAPASRRMSTQKSPKSGQRKRVRPLNADLARQLNDQERGAQRQAVLQAAGCGRACAAPAIMHNESEITGVAWVWSSSLQGQRSG